jgi:hypothetical protein
MSTTTNGTPADLAARMRKALDAVDAAEEAMRELKDVVTPFRPRMALGEAVLVLRIWALRNESTEAVAASAVIADRADIEGRLLRSERAVLTGKPPCDCDERVRHTNDDHEQHCSSRRSYKHAVDAAKEEWRQKKRLLAALRALVDDLRRWDNASTRDMTRSLTSQLSGFSVAERAIFEVEAGAFPGDEGLPF